METTFHQRIDVLKLINTEQKKALKRLATTGRRDEELEKLLVFLEAKEQEAMDMVNKELIENVNHIVKDVIREEEQEQTKETNSEADSLLSSF